MLKNKTDKENNAQNDSNTIKIGTFQLQTKSFWISLVAILCLFMLSVIWLNSFYWYKMFNVALNHKEIKIETQNKK